VALLPQRTLSTTAVTFNFGNSAYDQIDRVYYVSFAPMAPPLRGQLHRTNGTPSLQVSSTPGPVQNPQNDAMSMSVDPASGGAQSIRVASSHTASATKAWGM